MEKQEFLDKINEIEKTSSFRFLNLNNYTFNINKEGSVSLDSEDGHYDLKAYPQFLSRIGLNCPMMLNYNFVDYHLGQVTQLINKVLEDGPEIYSRTYVRGNDILACHSKDYRPLEISELVATLEQKLTERYENVDFINGYYSDEFTIVDFSVEDKDVVKAYEKVLANGSSFVESKLIVRFVTSHLGLSGANIYPMFYYKTNISRDFNQVPLTDKKIILKHEGDASIEKFNKNCDGLFPLVEMIPEQISKLDKITIEYPTHCVINLAEKVQIPAKKIKNIAEDVAFVFSGCKPTGKEIFQYFANVIQNGENEVEKMQLSEKVGKALRILREHPDDVDIPKTKWKRLGVLCDEGQDFIPDSNSFGPQMSIEEVA